MYRHARIMRIMGEAQGVVRDLFAHYVETPGELPAEWLGGLGSGRRPGRALRIADFIAGMTDRYALVEHARLFRLDAGAAVDGAQARLASGVAAMVPPPRGLEQRHQLRQRARRGLNR